MSYPDHPYEPGSEPDQEQRDKLHAKLDVLEASWVANRDALDRLYEAAEWLARHCRDEKVNSYARAASGGQLWKLGPSDWFVDDPLVSFVRGGGFMAAEGVPRIGGAPGRNYIFLDRAELETAIASVPVASRSGFSELVRWCAKRQAEVGGGVNEAAAAAKLVPEHRGWGRKAVRDAWNKAKTGAKI